MNKILLLLGFLFISNLLHAQRIVHGEVLDVATGEPVAAATISTSDSIRSVLCNEKGKFSIQLSGSGLLNISAVGYENKVVTAGNKEHLVVLLVSTQKELDAVVVTGTMKPVKKLESPVAVEVYTPQFFKKNPTPSIFESLQKH